MSNIGGSMEVGSHSPHKDQLEDGTWHHYPGHDQLDGSSHESGARRQSPGQGNCGGANQDERPWRQPRRDQLDPAVPRNADIGHSASGGRPIGETQDRKSHVVSGIIGY